MNHHSDHTITHYCMSFWRNNKNTHKKKNLDNWYHKNMCQNMILSFKINTLFSGQFVCNAVAPISAEIHSLLYKFIVIILNKYMGFKPQTIKINTHIRQLYSYIYIYIYKQNWHAYNNADENHSSTLYSISSTRHAQHFSYNPQMGQVKYRSLTKRSIFFSLNKIVLYF